VPDPTNPDDPVAWLAAATDYSNDQDYENALRCYRKATGLNQDFIDAWARMGLLLVKLGRFDEAHACEARVRDLNIRTSDETRRFREATGKSLKPDENSASPSRLKNPWAAGAASAVCPGWGQVYNGDGYGKGWLILAGLFLFALAGTFLTDFKGTYLLSPLAPIIAILPPLTFLLPVIVWIYSIAEASWTAHTINKKQHLYVMVLPGRLYKYMAVTYFIAAFLYLYYPMITKGLTGL
jgi:tetratricopeptide (TPR) repeat protein